MNKMTNDKGEVAVLYSPGYGAGWYSWNKDSKACLFDPEVVQWVLDGKLGEPPSVKGRYGDDFYDGGMHKLAVTWIPQGARFRIDEYDGYESVVVDGDDEWVTA